MSELDSVSKVEKISLPPEITVLTIVLVKELTTNTFTPGDRKCFDTASHIHTLAWTSDAEGFCLVSAKHRCMCWDQNERSLSSVKQSVMHDICDLSVIFLKDKKKQTIAYCIPALPIMADANAGIKDIINYLYCPHDGTDLS